MKVAIIGASGFIGSHLCEACIQRGYDVSALARNPGVVDELTRKGISAFAGDLENEEAVRRTCAGADVVFNVAGALGKWQTPPDELRRANALAAGQVVRWAARSGARKVVHASTVGVTGPLPMGVVADEGYPCNPVTEYQRTKLDGETNALSAHRETGISLAIVRPSFVYGPGDRHKLSLFRAIAAGRIVMVDHGASMLHPVYVDDLVAGLLLAAEKCTGQGDVYILGGESAVSVRSLFETIASVLRVPLGRTSIPSWALMPIASLSEAVGRRMGKEPPLTRSKVRLFSENYAYSIDKARRELGYNPTVHLSDGIRRSVEWYIATDLLKAKE